MTRISPEAGAEIIRLKAQQSPLLPGVYTMKRADGAILYIGKASNLRRRITSYTQWQRLPLRLQRMIALVADVEWMTTRSELEAILLEINRIQAHQPPYNVRLKDDKSYPFILIRTDHDFPQLKKHYGRRVDDGHYYGPFLSGDAVNRAMIELQKAFQLRICNDTVFNNRTRPCLQHYIKRCSAPCMKMIEPAAYAQDVSRARMFFAGDSAPLLKDLSTAMERAADAQKYEQAAIYRDRLRALSRIAQHQDMNTANMGDSDVVGVHIAGTQLIIVLWLYRGGRLLGQFPIFNQEIEDEVIDGELLMTLLLQHYQRNMPPERLMLAATWPLPSHFNAALNELTQHSVQVVQPKQGTNADLCARANAAAQEWWQQKTAQHQRHEATLKQLADLLKLSTPIQRIEVYDNSHTAGQNALGAMIVFETSGFAPKQYRSFLKKDNNSAGADDYALMQEVLMRRLKHLNDEQSTMAKPDLIIIDGGIGQLRVAKQVLTDFGISDIALLSLAKGVDRNSGKEHIFLGDESELMLDYTHPIRFFLQQLRDEAHRFVIGRHRKKRQKSMQQSLLDDIPGIGAKRRKALLHHFGGLNKIQHAGVKDLMQVEGVSETLAQTIFNFFHKQGSPS